jgi:hypothetical protein
MSYNSVAAAHGKLNKFSKLDIKINAAGMMVIVMMMDLRCVYIYIQTTDDI